MAVVSIKYGMAIQFCLLFNFAFVFLSTYFLSAKNRQIIRRLARQKAMRTELFGALPIFELGGDGDVEEIKWGGRRRW
jgi:hypothetical protein